MCGLPEAGGAGGPARLLRGAPLARRARLLPVLLLLQVPRRPALHGHAGHALLLGGVQEEDPGLGPGLVGSSKPCPDNIRWVKCGLIKSVDSSQRVLL